MSEGTTVYAVSSGAYSDYSVHCLFERREDAEAYLRAQGRERVGGEEWQWRKADGVDHDWDDWHIEPFQFWPAGVVPHVNA